VIALFLTKALSSDLGFSDPFAYGRAGAFLIGAIFSACVGLIGMRMATRQFACGPGGQDGLWTGLMLGYRTAPSPAC